VNRLADAQAGGVAGGQDGPLLAYPVNADTH
jgi:hypothetical protein